MQTSKIKSSKYGDSSKTYIIKYINKDDSNIYRFSKKADSCNDAARKLIDHIERMGNQVESFNITKEMEIGRW